MDPSEVLRLELEAYEEKKQELTKHYPGKFVLFHGKELIGSFDTFDNAAKEAVQKFGKGPYLIRQVGGVTGMPLPASVAYRPVYAAH